MDYYAHATTKNLEGIAKRLVDYIAQENIKLIIIPGTSAQSAARVLKDAFNEAQITSPRFIALGALGKNYGFKDPASFVSTKRHYEDAHKVIESRLNNLIKSGRVNPSQPTLILEEFVENGITTSIVQHKLQKMGFTRTKTGTFISTGTEKLDFVGAQGGEPYFFGDRRKKVSRLIKERLLKRLLKNLKHPIFNKKTNHKLP
jgi:hypothetical protein